MFPLIHYSVARIFGINVQSQVDKSGVSKY